MRYEPPAPAAECAAAPVAAALLIGGLQTRIRPSDPSLVCSCPSSHCIVQLLVCSLLSKLCLGFDPHASFSTELWQLRHSCC